MIEYFTSPSDTPRRSFDSLFSTHVGLGVFDDCLYFFCFDFLTPAVFIVNQSTLQLQCLLLYVLYSKDSPHTQ
jgi:hypothetical protein